MAKDALTKHQRSVSPILAREIVHTIAGMTALIPLIAGTIAGAWLGYGADALIPVVGAIFGGFFGFLSGFLATAVAFMPVEKKESPLIWLYALPLLPVLFATDVVRGRIAAKGWTAPVFPRTARIVETRHNALLRELRRLGSFKEPAGNCSVRASASDREEEICIRLADAADGSLMRLTATPRRLGLFRVIDMTLETEAELGRDLSEEALAELDARCVDVLEAFLDAASGLASEKERLLLGDAAPRKGDPKVKDVALPLASAGRTLRQRAQKAGDEQTATVLSRLAGAAERGAKLAQHFPKAYDEFAAIADHLMPKALRVSDALAAMGDLASDDASAIDAGLLRTLGEIAERAEQAVERAIATEIAGAIEDGSAAVAVHDLVDRRPQTVR